MRFRKQLEDHFLKLESQGLTIKEMAEKIADVDKKIDLKVSSMVEYLRKIRREHDDVAEIENTNSWWVAKDSYNFRVGRALKTFSIELIDNLFLYYSTKGYNYTRIKVQQRFDLTPKTWGQIARQFNLSKQCDILSPYTMTNTPKEELEILMESKIKTILSSGEMSTQKYHEAVTRKHRRIIEGDLVEQSWRQDVISELLEELPKVETIVLTKNTATKGIKEAAYVCGDLHAGGESSKMKITEDWNIDVLIDKLERMADLINDDGAEHVDLVILADLVESVSGLNHLDSWKGLGKGMFGSNIIILTFELIVKHLVNKIHNLRRICGCGGNHDRLQASNKNADTGATDLIFYLLQQRLAGTDVEVVYDPVVVVIKLADFGVIGVHGDKGLHKRSLEYLITKFALDRNQYQFVMSAHLHSFFCKMNDDQEIGRRVTVPAIITGNKYSDLEIGRASKSGFVRLKSNKYKQPEMSVVNI